MDHADAAWVGHVRAVLWGCKTVPCVSPCVHVFFDDDKLLSAPMAAAPTMVHNVRALSQRGFVGIAAPRAFAPRQQRAAFSMEAAAEGAGETAGAEGVKLYVGAFRSVPFLSPDVLTNALALRTRAGPPRAPSTAPTAMRID